MNALETTSTRPYLIRALHEWCTDNGFTPYIAVRVDETVQVPMEYVNNGEIVLNVGFDATGSLQLGNDYISFKARFGGVARDIMVPVGRVIAIYARENGQGMAFPPAEDMAPPPATFAAPVPVPIQAAWCSWSAASRATRTATRIPPGHPRLRPHGPRSSVSSELAGLYNTPLADLAQW